MHRKVGTWGHHRQVVGIAGRRVVGSRPEKAAAVNNCCDHTWWVPTALEEAALAPRLSRTLVGQFHHLELGGWGGFVRTGRMSRVGGSAPHFIRAQRACRRAPQHPVFNGARCHVACLSPFDEFS